MSKEQDLKLYKQLKDVVSVENDDGIYTLKNAIYRGAVNDVLYSQEADEITANNPIYEAFKQSLRGEGLTYTELVSISIMDLEDKLAQEYDLPIQEMYHPMDYYSAQDTRDIEAKRVASIIQKACEEIVHKSEFAKWDYPFDRATITQHKDYADNTLYKNIEEAQTQIYMLKEEIRDEVFSTDNERWQKTIDDIMNYFEDKVKLGVSVINDYIYQRTSEEAALVRYELNLENQLDLNNGIDIEKKYENEEIDCKDNEITDEARLKKYS